MNGKQEITHEDVMKYLEESVRLPSEETVIETLNQYRRANGGIMVKAIIPKTFPKEVINAFKILWSAQEMFNTACKEYAPPSPLKPGNKIRYKKQKLAKYKNAEITSVHYNPFSSGKKFGAWEISIKPLTCNFKPYKKYINNSHKEYLESSDKVILCSSKKAI